uniref:Uncharacterized protein n=1 Tax=Tetradesmus obliquus TaxID=3088 RepID=A0A383WIZ3_TETOB|eukprot:jgi/Sobl393_1/17882/SZX77437.1
MTTMQQQEQQQQQQHQVDALASCTEVMLAAATALVQYTDLPAEQMQLARACISANLLPPLTAALQQTALHIEAAETAVAAALADGSSLPALYNQQIPSPLLGLAFRLLQLFQAVCNCWPGPIMASAQLSPAVLPAVQLTLPLLQLLLRLLSGGNRSLFSSLWHPCCKAALAVAQAADHEQVLSPAAAAAEEQLVSSALLPQLQLLLLAVFLKVNYHLEQLANSSSSRQRRQQQHDLDCSKHRYLLAMLQELGLSDVQAAAAPFNTAAAAAAQASLSSSADDAGDLIIDLAESFHHSLVRPTNQLHDQLEAEGEEEQQQQQQQQRVEAGAAAGSVTGLDHQQLPRLSNLSQHASLMLLEAACNVFEAAHDVAAAVGAAAMHS